MNALDEAKAAAAALRSANKELVELRSKLLMLQQQDGASRKECARVDSAGRGPKPSTGKPQRLMLLQQLTLCEASRRSSKHVTMRKWGLMSAWATWLRVVGCVGLIPAVSSSSLAGQQQQQQQHLHFLQAALEEGSAATASKVQG